jgi:hypothetical protein
VTIYAAGSLGLAIESLVAAPVQSPPGGQITITMVVRNTGAVALPLVVPGTLVVSGTGAAVLTSSPGAQVLAPGAAGTFTWSYRATRAGTVSFTGGASAAAGSVAAPAVVSAPVTIRQDTGGKVVAFPNPWHRGDAPAVFRGLLPGETIRLYTVAGELVWEGSADTNGDASWNGRNIAASHVGPGLYAWITTGRGRTTRGRFAVE